jgi:hypothetical protein
MAEKRKDLAAHYHIDNEDGMKNLITRVFKRGDARERLQDRPEQTSPRYTVLPACGY